ncbi:MAG: thioredoxin family protein [Candidatus Sumerlaeia bacterium]|nr:thioredoxin family protein [Candidatus Sumerlaeia bacterium]
MAKFHFRLLSLGLLVLAFLPFKASAHWQSAGTLNIPEYNYSFLAATPSGDLLATTFYSAPETNPAVEMPAVLIRNPSAQRPEVVEVMRARFQPNRGFGGVTCDSTGAFFVSGDTGETGSSFVRKFNADGSRASSFGDGGEIRPGFRCMGLVVFGEYLLLAVNWGQVQIYNKDTGRLVGTTSRLDEVVYVRDLAIEPSTMRIFGVAEGAVVSWGQGTPWNPGQYRFQPISSKAGELRSGEGLSIDAIRRSVLVTPIPGNTLLEIEGMGRSRNHVVATADPQTHLADSVLSFDGSTLYISDMRDRKIHVMRRDMSVVRREQEEVARQRREATARQASGRGAASTEGEVVAPTWHRSYTEIVQRARTEGKPMVVYFRSPQSDRSREFEKEILLTDEFNRNAEGFYCVFEDVTRDQLLAFNFGVYRVPHIVILDPSGNTRAEYTWDIEKESLLRSMQATVGGE